MAIFSLLVFIQPLYASGFQLKTIGAMDVDGVTYKHLWYTNGKLTFTGVALANATITATIDGSGQTITTDASGNWNHSVNLANGDHQITFSSDGGSISFTLTIGEIPAGLKPLTKAQAPTVGIITPTISLLVLGGLSLSGLLLRKNLLKL